jgi:hypothetical protein
MSADALKPIVPNFNLLWHAHAEVPAGARNLCLMWQRADGAGGTAPFSRTMPAEATLILAAVSPMTERERALQYCQACPRCDEGWLEYKIARDTHACPKCGYEVPR